MSSNLRSPSQIPVRTKFLLGISDTIQCGTGDTEAESYFGNSGTSVIEVTSGSLLPLGPCTTLDKIQARIDAGDVGFINADVQFRCSPQDTTDPIFKGRLFKDLGRQLTVYDSTLPGSLHISTYRECQLVGGVNNDAGNTEGVKLHAYSVTPEIYEATYWVRVWAADGTGVAVARLG